MSNAYARKGTRGPFRADDVRPGDRYEISEGHAIYCAPTGGDGAIRTGLAFEVLDTDPAVQSAGVDAGYAPEPGMLRAPDVSVGNVPDARGWIHGVPPLALEYAGSGQDEAELQTKIAELLSRGTRHVWVVRLIGPKRIDVFEPNQTSRAVLPGELLHAPGILQNPVPVEALYDREAAHEAVLQNLLQRRGYAGLEAVRQQGLERGLEQGLGQGLELAIRDLCELLNIEWTQEREQLVKSLNAVALQEVRAVLKRDRRFPTPSFVDGLRSAQGRASKSDPSS